MKRTKILVTIGPASADPTIIKQMFEAGANAFRINMSHGSPEQWAGFITTIRSIAPLCPIIMDTKGPEVRLLNVPQPITVAPDTPLRIGLHPRQDMPFVSYPIGVEAGHPILFDDGLIAATVQSVDNDIITLHMDSAGTLTERRKVTVPNNTIDLPVLGEQDIADLAFCREHQVDAIALSFTQSEANIKQCREAAGNVMVIAKIENKAAVNRLQEIIGAADSVMVARGDLGVEIPVEEVPHVQKAAIRACNQAGKAVIVATQMLESMRFAAAPTRAEVSDVANAILDGADCCMLSAETASGKYPLQSVRSMAQIAVQTEKHMSHPPIHEDGERLSVADAISHSVHELASHLHVDAIVTATASGFTARMVSRFRPRAPIIGVCHDERAAKRLQLSWGIFPCVFADQTHTAHRTIYAAVQAALAAGQLQHDHLVIATAGIDTMKHGSTNLIEVHIVRDLISFHEQHKN